MAVSFFGGQNGAGARVWSAGKFVANQQDHEQLRARIRELESLCAKTGYTQVFIETPFRNESLLADILKVCRPDTMLSIAVNLTLPDESILSKPVKSWSKSPPDLKGKPAVFSIGIPAFKIGKGKY